MFKLSHEQLGLNKKSAFVGAFFYAFLIYIGEHNFHFGYEFGVLLFPVVIYYLNILLLKQGVKKYFIVFLFGALYGVVFCPIAKNLPFALPFIFAWFLVYDYKGCSENKTRYPLLFLTIFTVGSIFSQIQEIIALISHVPDSQRAFSNDRYIIKDITAVLSIFKLESSLIG